VGTDHWADRRLDLVKESARRVGSAEQHDETDGH
jgi:hypothetical protein